MHGQVDPRDRPYILGELPDEKGWKRVWAALRKLKRDETAYRKRKAIAQEKA
jgi:hypothetical protein